ncbi:hypothetical protein PUN28_004891 [Cardiocondyla obscurior]|uniref:Transmembrane protein n=1 Tax=Cardiocondyla obscurior TaxID=286306 RepID=A0AAW2GCZ6_9HYME
MCQLHRYEDWLLFCYPRSLVDLPRDAGLARQDTSVASVSYNLAPYIFLLLLFFLSHIYLYVYLAPVVFNPSRLTGFCPRMREQEEVNGEPAKQKDRPTDRLRRKSDEQNEGK